MSEPVSAPTDVIEALLRGPYSQEAMAVIWYVTRLEQRGHTGHVTVALDFHRGKVTRARSSEDMPIA